MLANETRLQSDSIAALQAQCVALAAERDSLAAECALLRASTSWRVTAPLRWLKSLAVQRASITHLPIKRLPELQELSENQRQFFNDNGYLILEGFFSPSQIQRVKAHINELWDTLTNGSPFVIDGWDATLGRILRTQFDEVDDDFRQSVYKLNDLHLVDETIQDVVADARLVRVLSDLLSAHPLVCNSFLMERGSQQGPHFDTFYMPAKTSNMMVASWIALDSVTDSNGPVFYYPKSHLIEPFRFSHGGLTAVHTEMPEVENHIKRIIREYDLKEKKFYPNPGDVLIWHSQLLHGDSPITDLNKTRTSLVTHYWTTLDYPHESDHINLGEGRLLLNKPHQNAVRRDMVGEIDRFISGLETSPEDLAAAPSNFDPRGYLLANPDIFAKKLNPYSHYNQYGRLEVRGW